MIVIYDVDFEDSLYIMIQGLFDEKGLGINEEV